MSSPLDAFDHMDKISGESKVWREKKLALNKSQGDSTEELKKSSASEFTSIKSQRGESFNMSTICHTHDASIKEMHSIMIVYYNNADSKIYRQLVCS